MGWSLLNLAKALQWGSPADQAPLQRITPITLPVVHAFLCAYWQLPAAAGLGAYLMTNLENQIAAAIRSVPIGQIAAQRILNALRTHLPDVMEEAARRAHASPYDLDNLAPQYAMVAARHESQFSRLFRS